VATAAAARATAARGWSTGKVGGGRVVVLGVHVSRQLVPRDRVHGKSNCVHERERIRRKGGRESEVKRGA
jgi:hypothetical protein